MDIQTQKLSLIESLINIDDNKALQKVKELLSEYTKVKPIKKTTPISLKEFYAKIDASEKAYKEGKTISSEQLRKEIKLWRRK